MENGVVPRPPNNFDALRLLFALFVLYAHAFSVSGGEDPILVWSMGSVSLSRIGVNGFFVISGFLVWRSMVASPNMFVYLRKRALRIFPALIVIVLLSVCLLGPLLTTFAPKTYWNDPRTWAYALNPVSMLRGGVRFDLPGVFTQAPVPSVNVSLWTIPYELFCYGVLLLFFPLKGDGRGPAIGLVVAYLLTGALLLRPFPGTIPHTSFAYAEVANALSYFLAGSVIAHFRLERSLARPAVVIGVLAALVLAGMGGQYGSLQHVLLPPLVIGIAYLPAGAGRITHRLGDVSYGTYLAGWPVQQALSAYLGLSGGGLLLCSAALAMGYGYLSWHLVEKRLLSHDR